MAIGILVIGDEILGARGLELGWAEYLGDDPARITATLARTFATDDVVFSFGGIGATPDDFTRHCAAAALGRPLERHPEAVRELESRFGKDAYPRRVLLAEFPQGADLVPNPVNRVAGFSVATHYFLPGFPEMAWAMMEWALDTKHRAIFRDRLPLEEAIIVDGAGETDLLEIMNAVVRDYPELKLSSLPAFSAGGARIIELAVRGDPARVPVAMAFVRDAIGNLGYSFTDRPAKPANAAP